MIHKGKFLFSSEVLMSRENQCINVRLTSIKDVIEINNIIIKTYPGVIGYSPDTIKAQLNHFPEGQFVVEFIPLMI